MPSRTAEFAWLPRTDRGLMMVKPAVVAAVALRKSRRLIERAFWVMRSCSGWWISRAFYSPQQLRAAGSSARSTASAVNAPVLGAGAAGSHHLSTERFAGAEHPDAGIAG